MLPRSAWLRRASPSSRVSTDHTKSIWIQKMTDIIKETRHKVLNRRPGRHQHVVHICARNSGRLVIHSNYQQCLGKNFAPRRSQGADWFYRCGQWGPILQCFVVGSCEKVASSYGWVPAPIIKILLTYLLLFSKVINAMSTKSAIERPNNKHDSFLYFLYFWNAEARITSSKSLIESASRTNDAKSNPYKRCNKSLFSFLFMNFAIVR